MNRPQSWWLVRLWLGVAVLLTAFAVRSAIIGDYGLMSGQVILAAFYVLGATAFARALRSTP